MASGRIGIARPDLVDTSESRPILSALVTSLGEANLYPTTVLLVEGHEISRLGLVAMLRSLDHVEVIGAVRTWEEGSELVQTCPAEIDLIVAASDIEPRTIDRFRRATGAGLLVLIRAPEPTSLAAAALLQADAYCVAGTLTVAELGRAIEDMQAGRVPMPPEMSHYLLSNRSIGPANHAVRLTERERDVLTLVSAGLRNREIADRLGISEHGVKHHVANVLMKLDAPNRALAVARGVREGLIRLE